MTCGVCIHGAERGPESSRGMRNVYREQFPIRCCFGESAKPSEPPASTGYYWTLRTRDEKCPHFAARGGA